jgi:rod shape-determining protein MreC
MLSANTTHQHQVARLLTLTVFFPFQYVINQTTRAKYFFTENKKLKEDIARLSVKYALLEEETAENRRLRDLLGFEKNFSYSLLPARAVVREPSYLYRTIVINAGKNKGIQQYMPVINKDGVVGKVIQVMPAISLVQLIRAPSERISVMIKKSGEVGIMETENRRDFFVKYRKYADIQPGDTVVASGYGGIYPRGLYVGLVTKIKEKNDPLFKYVSIKPLVDFEHIEEVFVMQLSPQWSTFREELDSLGLE